MTALKLKRAVFLDRDGVLNFPSIKNGKAYPPAHLDEVIIPSDARTALSSLIAHEFLLICVTNQPDVYRGSTNRETVESINQIIKHNLQLDDVLTCYHDDCHDCLCRKPKPGLILSAAERYQIDLAQSFMIGDRWRDIEAGMNAQCKTIWLNSFNYDEQQPTKMNYTAKTLTDATSWILNYSNGRKNETHQFESQNLR